MTSDAAAELALANGCGGYYLSVPPVWQDVATAQGWTYPCIVTLGDDGLVSAWTPV
jgi:hypothetical protein